MRHELEISPAALEALYATGHWLYSQLRIEQAMPVFRAMIHIAPEDERGWLALGACHEVQEQAHVALEIYGAAAAVALAAPRCELARARILFAHGREREGNAAIAEAGRIAEFTRDEELRALVARERRRG
jgi:tetratricopeptide (TPR) repeat protein